MQHPVQHLAIQHLNLFFTVATLVKSSTMRSLTFTRGSAISSNPPRAFPLPKSHTAGSRRSRVRLTPEAPCTQSFVSHSPRSVHLPCPCTPAGTPSKTHGHQSILGLRAACCAYPFAVRTFVFAMPLSMACPIMLESLLFDLRARNPTLFVYFYRRYFWLLVAAFFNVSKIPERIQPGLFDIVGHSHQLFHIFTFLSIYDQVHYVEDGLADVLLIIYLLNPATLSGFCQQCTCRK
uniref:Progestin and adipoQ receptor family member 9 n=1 Tax=Cyanistes caeruleus TaxID=156563 RepID=A0A8C0UY94_CYACU